MLSGIHKRNDNQEAGFTLMEVLIATAILAIVLSMVYGSFVQTRRVIGKAEEAVDELRGIRAAFSRMISDINMAYLKPPPPHRPNESTFFYGVDDFAYGYPNDTLDFTSYSNRIRRNDALESDQAEVGYYVKRNFDGTSVLMKREKRRVDENPLSGGKTYEISEDVIGLNFRFLDKDTWHENWDSKMKTPPDIPEAVEITIIVREDSGKERSYRTVVSIPLGK